VCSSGGRREAKQHICRDRENVTWIYAKLQEKKREEDGTHHTHVFYKKLIPCKGHKMEGGGAFEKHVKHETILQNNTFFNIRQSQSQSIKKYTLETSAVGLCANIMNTKTWQHGECC